MLEEIKKGNFKLKKPDEKKEDKKEKEENKTFVSFCRLTSRTSCYENRCRSASTT